METDRVMKDPGRWCRCGGSGLWMEQIDGEHSRLVTCPWRHDLSPPSDGNEMLDAGWRAFLEAVREFQKSYKQVTLDEPL